MRLQLSVLVAILLTVPVFAFGQGGQATPGVAGASTDRAGDVDLGRVRPAGSATLAGSRRSAIRRAVRHSTSTGTRSRPGTAACRPDAVGLALQDNNLRSITFGVDLAPRDTVMFGGSYAFENYSTLQRSRQATPARSSTIRPATGRPTWTKSSIHGH